MAYSLAPGRRMGYDEDGTIVYYAGLVSNTHYVAAGSSFPDAEFDLIGLTDRQKLNNTNANESLTNLQTTASSTDANQITVFMFPELRDIDGYFIARQVQNGLMVSYSADTTNGRDGSWTAFSTLSTSHYENDPIEEWRSDIQSTTASAVRAVRYASYCTATSCIVGPRLVHWYGEIASGESPDRILIFDNGTDLEFTKPLDSGDTPRGMAEDEATIYLRNNSGTKTANTTTVDPEDLESLADGWYEVNLSGGSFLSSISVTSITSGSDSGDIIVRRVTPDDAVPGLYAPRLEVKTASWT